jgi:hypothetical protein
VSANSHSVVNKVRNVAVTLLDNEPGEMDDQAPAVLLGFLALLTRIEDVSLVLDACIGLADHQPGVLRHTYRSMMRARCMIWTQISCSDACIEVAVHLTSICPYASYHHRMAGSTFGCVL